MRAAQLSKQILGGPGVGKTTLGTALTRYVSNYACEMYAEASLVHRISHAPSAVL